MLKCFLFLVQIRGYSEKYTPSLTIKPEVSKLQAFLKNIEAKNNKKSKTLKEGWES